uniref:Translation initiation factor eIF2B subunit epsilon n=1 Tax=Graphocephala atropunctata TaxID=36148 RepID=A0A1B6LJB8_9HEMI
MKMCDYNENILPEALPCQILDFKYNNNNNNVGFGWNTSANPHLRHTYRDKVQFSNKNFKSEIFRNIQGCNYCTNDTFEDIFERFRDKGIQVKESLKKNIFQKVHNGNDFAIDFFEDLVDSIREKMCYVKCYVSEKVRHSSEFTIDAFENLISKTKNTNMHFVSFLGLEDGVKAKLESDFEDLLEGWKGFLEEVNDKLRSLQCSFNEKTEMIIDEFDDTTDCLKTIKNRQIAKIECAKEEIVDNIEDLVESCKCRISYVEENIKIYLNEKKNVITDEVEDIFDDLRTNIDRNIKHIQCIGEEKKDDIVDEVEDLVAGAKWTLDDRKSVLLFDAECAFDDAIERAKVIINEGKKEINTEICHFRNTILMGETLLKEFLSYSEHFISELFGFSEQRLMCFLCEGKQKAEVFYNEVVDSLVRGYEDKLLCDNLVLEINSSRYAYNVTMSEVNYHVMRALLTLPRPDGAAWQQLASRLTYFMPILTNYIRSDAAQKDCLLAVEDIAGSHPEIMEVVMKIINFLYEKEILSEEAILYWYCNPCSETDIENGKRVRKQVAPFISWLEKAEEETSDDDDDEED